MCWARFSSCALPGSPGEGSNLRTACRSQAFVVRLQPVLLSPTSQRHFWSRDPPRSRTSLAFSSCFWFCLLLPLSSGVCVLSHMNSHSLNRKVEVRGVRAVHRGQERGSWSGLCCSHLTPLCEQAVLLLHRVVLAQLPAQSWQTPNVSLLPFTQLILFQEHGWRMLQRKSVSQTALGNLSYLSSSIFLSYLKPPFHKSQGWGCGQKSPCSLSIPPSSSAQ